MTLGELRTKWVSRHTDGLSKGALVALAAVAEEILRDLDEVARGDDCQLLSREEAAAVAGCHPDSISRLLRKRRLTNHGTASRPRLRRAEVVATVGHRQATGSTRPAKSESNSVNGSIAVASRLGRYLPTDG